MERENQFNPLTEHHIPSAQGTPTTGYTNHRVHQPNNPSSLIPKIKRTKTNSGKQKIENIECHQTTTTQQQTSQTIKIHSHQQKQT